MADFLRKLFQRADEATPEPGQAEFDAMLAHQIEHQRQAKDAFFKNGQGSPLSHEVRHSFTGLQYYPVDSTYRVRAQLERASEPQQITMPVSQGTDRTMLEWGSFSFNLNDQSLNLTAYKPADLAPDELEEAELFIPFRDATSGKETYGAGRYLDIEDEPIEEQTYIIDFNLAYNPWCAYNEAYSCPLPPQQNWLRVPILAGEKKPASAE